jgi:peptide chain release factor subunit 1
MGLGEQSGLEEVTHSEEDLERDKQRLRHVVKELRSKEGRGTELVSLYVPPGRRVSDVTGYLREEYSTASNIKSDLTRKHVQDAIVKVMERLKLVAEVPETGLVIFCGAIPQDGIGSERMEIYAVVPPEPINISLYRCDSHFQLKPLEEMLKEKEVYGLISMDINDAAIAVVEGARLRMLSTHTSGIPGKHRAGGQSARRFERLREMEVNEYFRRVAGYVNKAFLDPKFEDRLKTVIIGGPGFTKKEFAAVDHLDYRIRDMIVGYVDTNYAGEEGIRELIARSEKMLEGTRYLHEKEVVDEFVEDASARRVLATYGLRETLDALRKGAAEKVIIMENFKAWVYRMKCPVCGHVEEETRTEEEEAPEETCPSCGNALLNLEEVDIFDYLEEMRKLTGAKVETISPRTEHGRIFEQFSGIGAILRYSDV